MGTSIDSKETSAGNNNNELSKVVLRKPRSRSAGDILDERPKDEATAELKQILERQKAAAEKGEWLCILLFFHPKFRLVPRKVSLREASLPA